MKKLLTYLLILVFSFTAIAAVAEDTDEILTDEIFDEFEEETVEEEFVPPEYNYYQLTVGATTELSGRFFTDMWGYNTCDLDIRLLLNAYDMVTWNTEDGGFMVDDTVVSGISVLADDAGSHNYLVALNHDMAYSDGTPITAKDYAFSILLSMAPEVAELGGQNTGSDHIQGAQEYRLGQTNVLTGVQLVGDYELSVTVKPEYLPFFYELAFLDYYPYPIHVLAPGCEVADDGEGVYIRNIDANQTEDLFTAELLNETIFNEETGYMSHPSVVSGPYKLVSYEGNTAEFEINEFYKGNMEGELPEIQRITFTLAENETMMEKLAAGEFGLLNKVVDVDTINEGMELVGTDYYSMSNYARTGLSFMNFCCEKPTVESVAVRQAIAYCLDKDELVYRLVGDYGLRADGYYGLGQWMYLVVNGTMAPPVEEPAENANADEVKAYEDEMLLWDELNLDNVTIYELDTEKAVALLEEDGWTLNIFGGNFDPNTDKIRCKNVNGELVKLDLTMLYPEGNEVCDVIQDTFIDNLASVGIALSLEAKPMPELLEIFYRQQERDCDMIYVATNFGILFDPSQTFSPDPDYQGVANRTGIADEELYQAAVDMRKVEPGETLEYCQKWILFQERYAEVLPSIPVYSNVYFDFYTAHLNEYNVAEDISWSEAIVPSFMDDIVLEEEEEGEDEFEDEFELEFED